MRKIVAFIVIVIGARAIVQYYPEIPDTFLSGITTLSESDLLIVHLDVGQGDSTLILGPVVNGGRVAVLMDAGDIPNGGDRDGGSIVGEVLRAYGISQLDYFIASHYDADHIGGVIAGSPGVHGSGFVFGLNGVPGAIGDDDSDGKGDWLDDKMTEPDPQELGMDDDIDVVHFVDRGKRNEPSTKTYKKYDELADAFGGRISINSHGEVNNFTIDLGGGASMICYASDGIVRNTRPEVPKVNTENERSMCFLISYGDFQYLLGGDTIGRKAGSENAEVELAIARALVADEMDVDVYHVNHHGANNGSSKKFLDLIQPEVAVISLGDNNSHGHPHVETLQRLVDAGVEKIYQTQRGNSDDEVPEALAELQLIVGGHILLSSDGTGYVFEGKAN